MIATLLLGGNMGNRDAYLRFALFHIKKELGIVLKESKIYESEPWGDKANKAFLNQVIDIETLLPSKQLLASVLKIEQLAGRKRELKWGNRTLDIDILFMEDLILNERDITIPHPEIQNRRFTLIPLVEIKPNFVHPALKSNMKELLSNCTDSSSPKIYVKRGV